MGSMQFSISKLSFMTIPLKVFSIKELAGYLGGKMNTLGDQVLLCNDKRSLPEVATATPFLFESMLFSVCTHGYMRLLIDSREIEVKEGELLVVMPHKTIEVIESGSFRACHLCLDKEILSLSAIRISGFISIINKLRSNELFRPEHMQKDILTATLELIRNTLQNGGRHQEDIVIHLISSLFLFLDDMIADEVEKDCKYSRSETICRDFLLLVSEHHKEQHAVKFYADKLCLSPKHLALTIKSVMGQSASKVINSFIIQQAKSLLRYTDKTVQEIGYELNFSTQSFFGKYFKQHTGMSPGEYRSQEARNRQSDEG
ncbi:AraC family transcriptional regulator [Porphyromonas gulae]|uniref:AraC family transcriptional regulator n=2 Tax=Porphyromonas gulae TaxID=111105 RepID=A0A0A2FAA9_9PORP|nr:AraC family transcriptional regulator [Porphyromonas gulae]